MYIHNQCPLFGGQAVYRARTLFALIDDSIDFENACLQSTNSKILIQDKETDFWDLKLVPNPADQKISLFLTNNYSGICYIEITNSIGEIVLNLQKNCQDNIVNIETKNLIPGVYSIHILLGTKINSITKLVIAR
jgi:hypothetical protein